MSALRRRIVSSKPKALRTETTPSPSSGADRAAPAATPIVMKAATADLMALRRFMLPSLIKRSLGAFPNLRRDHAEKSFPFEISIDFRIHSRALCNGARSRRHSCPGVGRDDRVDLITFVRGR